MCVYVCSFNISITICKMNTLRFSDKSTVSSLILLSVNTLNSMCNKTTPPIFMHFVYNFVKQLHKQLIAGD